MSEPISEEEFGKALHEVVTSLAQRADEERHKDDAFKTMFDASESGLRSLLSEAYHQQMRISLHLADVICARFGIETSNKLWNLIRALPFALGEVRTHITETQGHACCADKARQVYYEEVLAEITRLRELEKKVESSLQ